MMRRVIWKGLPFHEKQNLNKSYMKIKSLLIGASVLGLASAAHAVVTPPVVVNITGATAFRAAAHAAIVAGFNSSTLQIGTTGSNSGNVNGHSNVIYKGQWIGTNGTTIIRTSWTGSVEGIRALAAPTNTALAATKYISVNATLLTAGNITTSLPTDSANLLSSNATVKADAAYSDCAVKSSPYAANAATLKGGAVGVIAFAPCVNKDANAGITNVTAQQIRELHKNGTAPLMRFTGNTSDTALVYNVQRYDGSGTRVIALSETGYGAATKAIGYVFGNFTLASTPTICPASNSTADYSGFGSSGGVNYVSLSTDFYPTALDEGNGGYVSGGKIASLFITTGSVNVVSVLGTSDAKTVWNSGSNGGRILSYNGEKLEGLATTGSMTTPDKDKVRSGKYSLWSFENFFYVGTPTGNKQAVINTLSTAANYDSASIALSSMQVKRTAATTPTTASPDAGVIEPK
ncbi:hypothetical protein EBU02_07240 [bacterium]|nr:hypothetical protein [bacterium]